MPPVSRSEERRYTCSLLRAAWGHGRTKQDETQQNTNMPRLPCVPQLLYGRLGHGLDVDKVKAKNVRAVDGSSPRRHAVCDIRVTVCSLCDKHAVLALRHWRQAWFETRVPEWRSSCTLSTKAPDWGGVQEDSDSTDIIGGGMAVCPMSHGPGKRS